MFAVLDRPAENIFSTGYTLHRAENLRIYRTYEGQQCYYMTTRHVQTHDLSLKNKPQPG